MPLEQLTNIQLDTRLARFSNYGGAIMKNQITHKARDKAWICNLESTYQGDGDHWTLCYPLGKDVTLFYDPFGFPPSECIRNWARKNGGKCYYSTVDCQDFNANSCGYWCEMIVQELEKGRNIEDLLRRFTRDTKANERKLQRYFLRK